MPRLETDPSRLLAALDGQKSFALWMSRYNWRVFEEFHISRSLDAAHAGNQANALAYGNVALAGQRMVTRLGFDSVRNEGWQHRHLNIQCTLISLFGPSTDAPVLDLDGAASTFFSHVGFSLREAELRRVRIEQQRTDTLGMHQTMRELAWARVLALPFRLVLQDLNNLDRGPELVAWVRMAESVPRPATASSMEESWESDLGEVLQQE